MIECWSIRIEKKNGEILRQWLIKNSLLNRGIKIQSKNNWIIFPLVRGLGKSEIKNLEKNIQTIQFEKRLMELRDEKRKRSLFEALLSSIPQNLHEYIPKSFNTIGNLVVIEIPKELGQYEKVIGETIIRLHPSLNSVFKKTEPVKGDFRIRDVELIAGINETETIHKENKCIFELDIRKVYFSPILATEHNRVCSLIKDNEVILDMFAGIGPFSVLIAKRKGVSVVAVDINPAAIYYLKKNIILNKVEKYVTVLEGDIRKVLQKSPKQEFDRIIMNLPSKSSEFLDLAAQILGSEGIIHYYDFVSDSNYPTKFLEDLRRKIEIYGRDIKDILKIRKVRGYAPYIWQVGVDILLK